MKTHRKENPWIFFSRDVIPTNKMPGSGGGEQGGEEEGTIPLTIASKRIKCLGLNLTKK